MRERWLRSNPRALGLLLPLPLLILFAGITALVVAGWLQASLFWWLVGGVVLTFGLATLLTTGLWTRRPRLAYEPGWLLVYLRGWSPERVPVDVVECFFKGNSPAMLPQAEPTSTRTHTIVVRLAESRPDWHVRPVRAALGDWSDGYITLRGTWCEPITPELLRDLNQRLTAAQRSQREPAPGAA